MLNKTEQVDATLENDGYYFEEECDEYSKEEWDKILKNLKQIDKKLPIPRDLQIRQFPCFHRATTRANLATKPEPQSTEGQRKKALEIKTL